MDEIDISTFSPSRNWKSILEKFLDKNKLGRLKKYLRIFYIRFTI